jgi:hypothetical protein
VLRLRLADWPGLSREQALAHLAWRVERAEEAGEPYALALSRAAIPPGQGPAQRRRALDALADESLTLQHARTGRAC